MGIGLIPLLALWGCGMMADSDKDESKKISIPQKISVEIPNLLKDKTQKNEGKILKKEESNSSKSIGFLELKDSIEYLEFQKTKLKLNLLFLGEVMEDIAKACQETKEKEHCSIAEDTLSFSVTQAFKEKIIQLDADEGGLYDRGETIYLGAIDFIQYTQSDTYQYALKLQNSDTNNSTLSIQWTEDEKHVNSLYRDGGAETNTIDIDYFSLEEGEQMEVRDGLTTPDYRDTFYFDFAYDGHQTYNLYAQSKVFEKGLQTEASASDGEITEEGGEMFFVGLYPEYRLREYEVFDRQGNLRYDEWCVSTDEECLISDEATWWSYGEDHYLTRDSDTMNEIFDILEEGIEEY